MGADLYIQSITDKAREEHQKGWGDAIAARNAGTGTQKEVEAAWRKLYPKEGYFRDSYNDSNLLWTMGLDYWKWFAKMLDEEGMLSVENAKLVRDEVLSREMTKIPEWEDEDARAYFTEKRTRFIAFLERAIELNEPIYCSI